MDLKILLRYSTHTHRHQSCVKKEKRLSFRSPKPAKEKEEEKKVFKRKKQAKRKKKNGLKKINCRTEWKGRWFHMIVQPQHELEEDSCDLE